MGTSETGIEPVAVSVEFVFDEVVIYFYVKFIGKGASLAPGGALHFEAGDAGVESVMMEEGVTEFVKKEEVEMIRIFNIENGVFGTEGKFFAFLKHEFGVALFNFFQKVLHKDGSRS